MLPSHDNFTMLTHAAAAQAYLAAELMVRTGVKFGAQHEEAKQVGVWVA